MHHRKTTALLLCALFTALISASAFIRIPTPLVPMTLQSGMVLLAGTLLGSKYGSVSVLIYVLLGLMGVPVFTMGGGLSYVIQPTFGYLIGFILGAYITGAIVWRKKFPNAKWFFVSALAGLGVIYLIGTLYCYWMSAYILGTAVAFWPLFVSCIILPLPGDLALCILVSILGKRMLPHTKNYIA